MSTVVQSPVPAGGCGAPAAAGGCRIQQHPADAAGDAGSNDVYNNEYNQFMVSVWKA
jgi:hypothetical protein